MCANVYAELTLSSSNFYIQKIQKAIDFIEENINIKLGIRDIAKQSGLSTWEFQRVFRSATGNSVGEYTRGRKLTFAAQSLQETKRSILEIALDAGFSSHEAFSRAFKKQFQINPSDVRTQNKSILLKKKPQITKKDLLHFNGGIELVPEIFSCPARTILGLKTKTPSPFFGFQNYDEALLPHWQKLSARKNEITNFVDGYALGVVTQESIEAEELDYIAAYEVKGSGDTPKGMEVYEIPASQYAVFTNTGSGNKSAYTVNYIYGTWLPLSSYKRNDHGVDFELFDDRYIPRSEKAVSEFHLPIVQKK